jgi:hypothetical protein
MATRAHPEVKARKQSRSNAEQAVGQSRGDSQRTRLGGSQGTLHGAQATRKFWCPVQMEFCWISSHSSSWPKVSFTAHAQIPPTGFLCSMVFYLLDALRAAS